jgi:hypothetical protein
MNRGTTRAAIAVALLALATPAHAQWSASAAVERFRWHEHTTPIAVRESGPRFAGAIGWALPVARGPLVALRAGVSGGNVDYSGSFQADTTRAATGASTYTGWNAAGELHWRVPRVADAVAAFEYEAWRRHLSRTQDERYRITSARFGLERGAAHDSRWSAALGLRTILDTSEDASIAEGGVTYGLRFSPGTGSNVYGRLGWRLRPHVTAEAYVDAMRLGRSNTIQLRKRSRPVATVFQPASDLDVTGVRLVCGW